MPPLSGARLRDDAVPPLSRSQPLMPHAGRRGSAQGSDGPLACSAACVIVRRPITTAMHMTAALASRPRLLAAAAHQPPRRVGVAFHWQLQGLPFELGRASLPPLSDLLALHVCNKFLNTSTRRYTHTVAKWTMLPHATFKMRPPSAAGILVTLLLVGSAPGPDRDRDAGRKIGNPSSAGERHHHLCTNGLTGSKLKFNLPMYTIGSPETEISRQTCTWSSTLTDFDSETPPTMRGTGPGCRAGAGPVVGGTAGGDDGTDNAAVAGRDPNGSGGGGRWWRTGFGFGLASATAAAASAPVDAPAAKDRAVSLRLLPPALPAAWTAGIANGSLLFSSMPEPATGLFPGVGNGYVGATAFDNRTYIAGVYASIAGYSWPHRAALPAAAAVAPAPPGVFNSSSTGWSAFGFGLDIQHGVFKTLWWTPSNPCAVAEVLYYAHRVQRHVMVSQVTLDATGCAAGNGSALLPLFALNQHSASPDINLQSVQVPSQAQPEQVAQPSCTGCASINGTVALQGLTTFPDPSPEAFPGGVFWMAGLVYNTPPPQLVAAPGASASAVVLAAYGTAMPDDTGATCSANPPPPPARVNCGAPGVLPETCLRAGCCFDDSIPGAPWCFVNEATAAAPVAVAAAAFAEAAAAASNGTLLASHMAAWQALTSVGIFVTDDARLAATVRAAYYYILASIRDDWYQGLSPGGLVTGGGSAPGYPEQEADGYFGCVKHCPGVCLPACLSCAKQEL